MALYARVKEVTQQTTTTGEGGQPEIEDLSLTGQVLVYVDYIDSASPNHVIHTQAFQVPTSESEQQILERFLTFGASVRDARIRATELQQHVGASFPIT